MNYIHSAFLRLLVNYTFYNSWYGPDDFVITSAYVVSNFCILFLYFDQDITEHPDIYGGRAIMLLVEVMVLPFLLMCLTPFFMQKVKILSFIYLTSPGRNRAPVWTH